MPILPVNKSFENKQKNLVVKNIDQWIYSVLCMRILLMCYKNPWIDWSWRKRNRWMKVDSYWIWCGPKSPRLNNYCQWNVSFSITNSYEIIRGIHLENYFVHSIVVKRKNMRRLIIVHTYNCFFFVQNHFNSVKNFSKSYPSYWTPRNIE